MISVEPIKVYVSAKAHDDGVVHGAMQSVRKAVEEGQASMDKRPGAYLRGEWGLKGTCTGYAMACVDWVEKHGHEAEVPPLMTGWPDESIRHVSKLLVLAIYQSIGKGIDPGKIARGPEHRESIERICRTFEGLQRRRTGVAMERTFPGLGFADAISRDILASHLGRLCQDQFLTAQDHFVLIMNEPGKPMFDWHTVYINPKLGIIGDGGCGLLWKIDEKAREFFPQVFKKYLEEKYSAMSEGVLVSLKKDATPHRPSPLILSRIFRRGQTAFNIARHSGPLAGAKYLWAIHKNNSLITGEGRCLTKTEKAEEKA